MENINDQLNELVELLQDSRNGYKECSKDVTSEKMKNLFLILADKRENMLKQLRDTCPYLSAFSKDSGSLMGKAHQFFVNLKSLVSNNSVDSIVQEIKRGENTLIEAYTKLLRKNIPDNIKKVLSDQFDDLERDLVEIDKKAADLL